MTLVTAMTMNRRGPLNGVGHSPEMGDGREHRKSTSATKCDAVALWFGLLGDGKRDMLQLHPAAASRSPRAPGTRPHLILVAIARTSESANVAPGRVVHDGSGSG